MPALSDLSASGKITQGIQPNTFVDMVTRFVEEQLPHWRDDKTRPTAEAEEHMNGQLCKFLDDRARDQFPMANFHHEERQGTRRRVDMSVVPSTKAIEAALYNSIYEPVLVIEGKRLPSPSKKREREYVTGLGDTSGGIQRFRMGLHGKDLAQAIIVAYVQKKTTKHWHGTINGWIAQLEKSGEDTTCDWTVKDYLLKLSSNSKTRTSRCKSSHSRNGQLDIQLVHLWVCFPPKKPKKKASRRSA